MATAWIYWRTTKGGARLASVRWYGEDGRQRSKALGISDERVAEVFRKAKERELGTPSHRVRSPYATVQEAVGAFLEERKLTVRPATVAQYRQRLD